MANSSLLPYKSHKLAEEMTNLNSLDSHRLAIESSFHSLLHSWRQQCCSCNIVSVPFFSDMDSQSVSTVTNVEAGNSATAVPGSTATLPEIRTTGRQWNLIELSVLIAAKRAENEKTLTIQGRDRIKTADTRWNDIQQELAKSGVQRSALQSKKRWEKLMTDFKKVYDYDRNLGSGQQPYYQIGSAERNAKKLPPQFHHELFSLMLPWVPDARAVNPDGNRVMDTGNLEDAAREAAESVIERPAAPNDDPMESEYTENIAEDGFDGTNFFEESTSVARDVRGNSPPATSDSVRKKPKSKRESLDDQFKKANQDFLGFLGKDSDKRARLDEASVSLEKEKHTREIAQQEKLVDSLWCNQQCLKHLYIFGWGDL